MAYCPNCAAVLDPTQKFCARCGQPSTIFVPTAPPPMQAVAAAGDRPSSVKIGTGLTIIAMVIGFFSYFRIFLTPGMFARLPSEYFLRVFGFLGIEVVLIVCVWKRQAWARIGLALMLLWAIYNLTTSFIRYNQNPMSYAFPLFLELVRIAALVFLFKPESNAWYKRS